MRAESAGGPEVRFSRHPRRPGHARSVIAAAMDSETRAVVVSLVDFQTGFRVDLDGMREVAG